MNEMISDKALNMIFRQARSYNAWSGDEVPESRIRAVYDLARLGATSANCSPARFVWLPKGSDGRKRLIPHLMEGNQAKTEAAQWTVIIAQDYEFTAKMDRLFPHNLEAASWFEAPEARMETMLRNATLQGAYLMIAARALGLDCGPMSGFDPAGVKAEFFTTGEEAHWTPNFICNVGIGTDEDLFERSPRLEFDEACRIL